jgi:hypothetical protein
MIQTYDMAISFAGEQRQIARSITRQLNPLGYSVFYDEYNQSETWGADLSELFVNIYSETKCILILVSREYLEKSWTRFERRAAVENFIYHPDAKLLQLKIDHVDVPGIPSIMGTVDYNSDINSLCATISSILGPKAILTFRDGYEEVVQVMKMCFRRAIFTGMNSEISGEKMFASIENCIGELNRFLPGIQNPEISQFVKGIVKDLDEIDRYSVNHNSNLTLFFSEIDKRTIDSLKVRIIDKLHYLNYRFSARIDLPDDIGLNYNFDQNYQFVDENIMS